MDYKLSLACRHFIISLVYGKQGGEEKISPAVVILGGS